jgi:hypothetical protein
MKQPIPTEVIEVDFISKTIVTQKGLNRLIDMIVQSFQDEDDYN